MNIQTYGAMLVVFLAGCGGPSSSSAGNTMASRIDRQNTSGYTGYSSRAQLAAALNLSVEKIAQQSAQVQAEVCVAVQEICCIPPLKRTFSNTVRAYDRASAHLNAMAALMQAMVFVSPDEELRNAAQSAMVQLEGASVDVFNTTALYRAFCEYEQHAYTTEQLLPEERYLFNELLKEFKRIGLNLSEATLAKVNVLKKKIGELSVLFEKNIASDNRSISVLRDGLSGLTEEFINTLQVTKKTAHPSDAQATKGSPERSGELAREYQLGTDYPTYFMVMDYCDVPETRRNLYRAFNQRAYPANVEVLNSVIAYRDEMARLLGFKSFAEYNLADQMVGNPSRADRFITEVWERVNALAKNEIAVLSQNLPEGVELTGEGKLTPWDYPYVKAHYKKEHFNLDERVIAEYFPMAETIQGLFSIYQQFLGLRFEVTKCNEFWSDDLQLVEVFRSHDNQFLGFIILDLYPRANKFSHACHLGLVSALAYRDCETHEEIRIPSSAIVIANFAKPTSDTPSLLTHKDVVTFFHEFGHALHAILGITHTNSCSGTSVKTDFVELPSQMFECWMWEPSMLKLVSHHYKTGEPLTDQFIETMVTLQHFDAGCLYQRQCALSFFALDLFAPGAQKDSDAVFKTVWMRAVPELAFDNHNHMAASFGHLMGYGAKYYGYLWSRVFAYDIFEEIKREGLLNPRAGKRFVTEILGRGGSADPNELLVNYLGREPRIDAFLDTISGK